MQEGRWVRCLRKDPDLTLKSRASDRSIKATMDDGTFRLTDDPDLMPWIQGSFLAEAGQSPSE